MKEENARKQEEVDAMMEEVIHEMAEKIGDRQQAKKRKFPCLFLCIVFTVIASVSIFANVETERQFLQSTKDFSNQIAEMEEQQRDLEAEKEMITKQKNELVLQNKELQDDIQNLDACLKVQLSRKNLLQNSGEVVDEYPVFVNAEESIPLIGYLQDSKKEAKKTPLLLTNRENKKGFYSLKIAFLQEASSKVEIFVSGQYVNLEISEGKVLIPLLNDEINFLKIIKDGQEYHLGMKWENHVEEEETEK